MSAAWLRQMGHRDVFVVEGGLEAVRTTGTAAVPVPELAAPVELVDVPGLLRLLGQRRPHAGAGPRRSVEFRDGHIPGAVGACAAGWSRCGRSLPAAGRIS